MYDLGRGGNGPNRLLTNNLWFIKYVICAGMAIGRANQLDPSTHKQSRDHELKNFFNFFKKNSDSFIPIFYEPISSAWLVNFRSYEPLAHGQAKRVWLT